jgi:enoyl-CoA hydratase/carnithine racemase
MGDLVSLTGGIRAEIELRNPPMNLVSHDLTVQLRAALNEVAQSSQARVLVVHGSGDRAFCAGSDVREFEQLHGRVAEEKLLLEKLVYRQLARLAIPTIASIEGFALGGGLELALCCDLRVAGAAARLGMPELRLGVVPGSGGTQRLPRIVGPAVAKEMILLGEVIDAEQAARMGLVNRVVAAGQALSTSRGLADTIAARGPVAVRVAKRLIDEAGDRAMDDGLALELDASEEVFASSDMLEGASAFLAKRPPDFQGH